VSILYWTLGLVLLQRVVELVWARRNAIRLRQLGGVEADAEGYPYFVLLHASWLASLVVFVPAAARPVPLVSPPELPAGDRRNRRAAARL